MLIGDPRNGIPSEIYSRLSKEQKDWLLKNTSRLDSVPYRMLRCSKCQQEHIFQSAAMGDKFVDATCKEVYDGVVCGGKLRKI